MPDNNRAEDVDVIEFPAETHVYSEDDDLDLPDTNKTGDHTGGLGPL